MIEKCHYEHEINGFRFHHNSLQEILRCLDTLSIEGTQKFYTNFSKEGLISFLLVPPYLQRYIQWGNVIA